MAAWRRGPSPALGAPQGSSEGGMGFPGGGGRVSAHAEVGERRARHILQIVWL